MSTTPEKKKRNIKTKNTDILLENDINIVEQPKKRGRKPKNDNNTTQYLEKQDIVVNNLEVDIDQQLDLVQAINIEEHYNKSLNNYPDIQIEITQKESDISDNDENTITLDHVIKRAHEIKPTKTSVKAAIKKEKAKKSNKEMPPQENIITNIIENTKQYNKEEFLEKFRQQNNTDTDVTENVNNVDIIPPPDMIIPQLLDKNYTTTIKYICHFSDIHIQLYKRHDEYQTVFNRLYDFLEYKRQTLGVQQNVNIPMIAVITGDLLHSKSDLSPECVQLAYNLIKTVSSIMPLVIIPGNHDININNLERLDSITPIIADLNKVNPIYYLPQSGVYKLSNLLLYHASVFDYKIIDPSNVVYKHEKDLKHIMLYHGRVNGAVYFNGIEIQDEVNNKNNKTITPSTFDHYDLTLLGDIHKHQFLETRSRPISNIGYAGSLIQQNMGETISGHGLITWDLADCTGVFNEINSDSSYVVIHVNNKQSDHYCMLETGEHNPNCTLSKLLRLRVLYKNSPESYIDDLITLIKNNHKVIEYSYQNNDDIDIESNNDIENSETSETSETTRTQIDITSIDVQNKYIIDYIKSTNPNITDDDCNEIKQMNSKQNETISSELKNRATIHNSHYKIRRIEFSNLFSFGNNNVIEFTNFKGIVGIIAPNHMGKSAILDIIIYTLFDKCTRKGTIKDIINNRRQNFSIKMEISLGQWIYYIEKSGLRTKSGATVKVNFNRIHDIDGIIECLDEDSNLKTREKIAEYFGYYEDIIHTSFSVQHDNCCFIDAENTERKKELTRIMRFEIIDELYKQANSMYNKHKTVLEHLQNKLIQDDLIKANDNHNKCIENIQNINKEKQKIKDTIRMINSNIITKTSELNQECEKILENNDNDEKLLMNLIHDIEIKKNDLDKLFKIKNDLLQKIVSGNNNNILDIKKNISNQDKQYIDKLKDFKLQLKDIDTKKNELFRKLKPLHNTKLKNDDLHKLLTQNQNIIHSIENDIEKYKKQIIVIQGKNENVMRNNLRIEEIDKVLNEECDLPEKLMVHINNNCDTLSKMKDEINKLFMNWFQDAIDNGYNDIELLCEGELYDTYIDKLQHYCFIKELINYKDNNSKTPDILEKLETEKYKLANEIVQIKKEQKEIKNIEILIKNEEIKLMNIQKAINNIKSDITNIELNKDINNEIDCLVDGKIEIDLEIEDIENKIDQNKNILLNIQKLESTVLKIKSMELEIEKINDKLEKYQDFIESIGKNQVIKEEITELQDSITQWETEYDKMEKKYNVEQMNLSKYAAQIAQFKKDNKERKDLEHVGELWEIYKNTLKQLPYILLDKIKPILEKKVNDMLSLATDFSIQFDMSDNKIDIYLHRLAYKDRSIIVNNASGFERFMSSLAIRMALLELSNLPKINFMAIDEGWSSFDNHNINNVNVIMDYLKTKFDFILTISHITQIKEHCDQQIFLKKDKSDYSIIVYNE
jgi:DNA repair exonuclease SbcCD ATPase subunit